MPIVKQHLQCPFCSTVSTRGTGLSSHIRTQHAAHYKKWNRNPDRLAQAAANAPSAAQENHKVRKARAVPPPQPVEAKPQPAIEAPKAPPSNTPQRVESDGHDPMALLQEAHDRLVARKQTIEEETAKIEALKKELDAVAAQLAAIEQAMSAFR